MHDHDKNMYFDTLTLTAITDELRSTILNGRVQRVLLPSLWSIGLEVYANHKRHQLLVSAHPQFARVHLVGKKLSRGVEQVTPLLLLLRKYVLGGHIIAIEQPVLERILILSIVKDVQSRNQRDQTTELDANLTDADPDSSADDEALINLNADSPENVDGSDEVRETLRCDVIIEPMERRSNIILVDDNNLVLDSIKRVTPRMSRRVMLPRRVYELPPVQSKRDPRNATAAGMQALRETGESDLVRALIASYRGISPQVAREVAWRALERPTASVSEDLPWYTLAARLRELFSAPWAPTLALGDDGPRAYAPYAINHLSPVQAQPSISAAVEAFYTAREKLTSHSQRRAEVQQQLDTANERLQHQYNQIAAEMERAKALDRLRWEGEMIFAFMHTLTPGQQILEVEGQTIELDPSRSPVECAQERFRAYDKAKSALAGLPERLHATQIQLDGIEQLAVLLDLAEEREQIEQIAREGEELGYIKRKTDAPSRPRRAARVKPLHLVSSDGFDIYVGRSASQNDEVTFRIGRPDDLWVHVRTIHGAHVIIRASGRDVPERTIREAAGLAAYFSRARAENAVEVDLSRRSQVRKAVGGPPGLVTYRAEQTVRVAPLPPWGG
jgi:predicted ribosome quality control (RQC) complex YloA/Tae2 family protein